MPFVHITPPCPRCGSKNTGRFILYNGIHADQMISSYMKNGELVTPCSSLRNVNCICSECGAEWAGEIKTKYLTAKELKEHKIALGITENLISDTENGEVHAKLEAGKKKKKEYKMAKKMGGFLGSIAKNMVYYTLIDPIKTAVSMIPGNKSNNGNKDDDEENKQ